MKRQGGKEKNEEEEVQCEVLNQTEEKSFSTELRDSWCQELVTCRYDASKDLESSCGAYVSYGKVEFEAAAGNTSTTSLSLFMETYRPGSGRRALLHGYSVLGRRSMDRKKESRAKISLDEADSRG